MTGFNVEIAKQIIEENLGENIASTKYISVYRTRNGRELALQKNRKTMVSVWTEDYDKSISEIEIKNEANPGKPYSKYQSRSSNSNSKKLRVGNEVYYLKINTVESLKKFLEWYQVI